MFQKILIANRGEIALRIIKTCRKLGITSVIVYSDEDAELPFVKQGDITVRLGPGPVQQSYLLQDRIIDIAKEQGVDAIHPGYGLLSENSEFAKKVEGNDITFIGPDSNVIELMGDKIIAKKTMRKANVPVIPGTDEGVMTVSEALEEAKRIGYPLMLKASGGGGGIGMVLCEDEATLSQQFESTRKRSEAYFKSDRVFLEKYIPNARHVEVQIFGDGKNTPFHLFERNCSIQRRNQKVVEEAPSPELSKECRERLFEVAVNAAKAVQYKNAGTVEFIVDEKEEVYFLEMNTRLQVEHAITEEITGIDLVEWQLLVACESTLPLQNQKDIEQSGHSIEFRIYAEDPVKFFPSPGTLRQCSFKVIPGIRIDYGYATGNKVTPFYDPLIMKVIAYATTRDECIQNAKKYLATIEIEGVKTNIPFLLDVLQDEVFLDGKYTTKWINDYQNKKGKIKHGH
ncbi:biotin carboxylase [Bacillus coahuilensis p1.1.43]|uniref:Biotin carboxylase n=1 Tax=Bacillus coahuilensis p1.1.43 TaxID=1150625 RepID=A0A147K9V3_9BACI|nr:biotin carboxylase N-terminal domain-containing protein [Bacillus coahuilensis]KUP07330.1 biotin carboxylase [Bacillus coahuilensis p1.1.43]